MSRSKITVVKTDDESYEITIEYCKFSVSYRELYQLTALCEEALARRRLGPLFEE